VVSAVFLFSLAVAAVGMYMYFNGSVPGYKKDVVVDAGNRFDWTFTENGVSKLEPFWNTFDVKSIKYEFYAPPNLDASRAAPLIVFLGTEPATPSAGWGVWRKLCQEKGILFAAPPAGAISEARESWERTRVVCDVVDDVRRKYNVDPDRTYLSGIGGGARLACRIGLTLPEVFGGIIALDGADFPKEEIFRQVFCQQRVSDRLSIAFGLPDNSPNKDRAEYLYKHYFEESKTRSKLWTYPDQTGGLPPPAIAEEMFRWLEVAAEDRGKLAEKYPATRVARDPLPPEQMAEAVLAEAKKRMKEDPASPVGMALLKGITFRWADTAAAVQAKEVAAASGKSLEAESEEAKRSYRLALGKAIEQYLTALDPAALEKVWDFTDDPRYGKEPGKDLREKAVFLWSKVKESAARQKNAAEVSEADKHMTDLKKIAPKGKKS
jgi:pimeloyl-ACP methyl ester carboxylesterase